MNRYGFGFSSMLLLWGCAISVYADNSVPQYQAEPCCQLCPDAQANLKASGLLQGKDGWLFPVVTSETTMEWLGQQDRQHLLPLFVRQMAIKQNQLMLIMPRTLMHANQQQGKFPTITSDDYQQTLAYFRQLPLFQTLPEQMFTTRMQGWLKINDTLSHQAQAPCDGLNYLLEYTHHFMTQNTCISTTTDGESRIAWMNLLISAPFQHRPTALILSELPASLLRQLVAKLNNDCESSPLLEHSEKTFQGKKLEDLVFANRLLKTNPSDLIVDLKLSDHTIEQLLLTIWYSDGGKSAFQIRKNTLSGNPSRFSFILGNASTPQQRVFVALYLSLMGSANGNITVSTKVCRLPDKLLQKTEI